MCVCVFFLNIFQYTKYNILKLHILRHIIYMIIVTAFPYSIYLQQIWKFKHWIFRIRSYRKTWLRRSSARNQLKRVYYAGNRLKRVFLYLKNCISVLYYIVDIEYIYHRWDKLKMMVSNQIIYVPICRSEHKLKNLVCCTVVELKPIPYRIFCWIPNWTRINLLN